MIKGDGAQITPQEQLVWTCPDGKLEIRFSPATTAFLGAAYEAPRGGRIYSGTPRTKPGSFRYRISVTTPDGFLLDQTAKLSVIKPRPVQAKSRRRK